MAEPKKPRRPGSRPGEEKRGRKPVLFDPEVRKRLIDALAGGSYQETACDYAGVAKTAYYDALARGRAERDRIADGGDDPPKGSDEAFWLALLNDVERARAQAKVRALTLIQKAAGEGAWQAAAWYLERTAPQEFGRSTRITGADGGPVQLGGNVHVTVDELADAIDEIIGDKPE